jgi:hypothetical protein
LGDRLSTFIKSLRITPELWARVVERAKAGGMSANRALIILIEKGLKEVE